MVSFNVVNNYIYVFAGSYEGFRKAIEEKEMQKIKTYIRSGYDVNWKDTSDEEQVSLLHIAVKTYEPKIVELLLKNGADPNIESTTHHKKARWTPEFTSTTTPIELAIYDYNIVEETLHLLIEYGADVNKFTLVNRSSPLFTAVDAEDYQAVEVLLKSGANPNILNKFGYTPLMSSFQVYKPNITELLLEYGADPSIQSKETLNEGKTILELHENSFERRYKCDPCAKNVIQYINE
ncbi:ankyrin repeat domain-containing protein [Lysinibacillus sp. NPDC093692]|uniref:ankyrin repeat domain-containing protein n=1 Tax=Lysinibacillus sp. NPDC093692 TaxID=3390578 RepID=UPI003D04B6B4